MTEGSEGVMVTHLISQVFAMGKVAQHGESLGFKFINLPQVACLAVSNPVSEAGKPVWFSACEI